MKINSASNDEISCDLKLVILKFADARLGSQRAAGKGHQHEVAPHTPW